MLKDVIKTIKAGGVIVCPTDTVYGLIADATNKKAVEKIFKIKKRLKTKPLPIFVKDIKMAKNLAEINKEQEFFLKSVWPGKVTVVLKRKKTERKLYGLDKKTIALRISKYKLLLDLIKKLGCPLIQTSANISDQPASTKIKEVTKQFEDQEFKPDLVIDAGDLKDSKPSTIIDLTKKEIKILRQ